MNKKIKLLLSLVLMSAVFSPAAHAEVEANVAIQSDYVWRGVSQNSEDPSIQGGFDYAHESGAYVGIWGASVDFGGDESTEIDLYAGWSKEFETGLGIDVGIIEYTYHGGPTASGDFTEYYLGLSYAGFGITFSAGDEGDDNIELSYGYDFESGFSVAAAYADFDSYTYYTVGASTEVSGIGIDLSYWGTDSDGEALFGEYADGRLALTLSKSF